MPTKTKTKKQQPPPESTFAFTLPTCIKSACPNCRQNKFFHSYYTCTLIGKSFKKDADRYCPIAEHIAKKEIELNKLKELNEFVEYNQAIPYLDSEKPTPYSLIKSFRLSDEE